MDDDVSGVSLHVSDFQNDGGPVRTNQHGEPLTEVPRTDRVAVGVKNVGLHEAVLQR